MERINPLELARRLIRARKAADLTQVELARKAKKSPATISGLESGKIARPHLGTILDVAEALDIELSELTGEDSAAAPTGPPPRSMDELLKRAGVADRELAIEPRDAFRRLFDDLSYEEVLALTRRVIDARHAIDPLIDHFLSVATPKEASRLENLRARAAECKIVAILEANTAAQKDAESALKRGEDARVLEVEKQLSEVA